MLRVYNTMALGVGLTGVVAYFVAQMAVVQGKQLSPLGEALFKGPLFWVILLAPLALVFAMSLGSERFSAKTLTAMFYSYAALFGVSLSAAFIVYTGASITKVFFITATAFGALSLWGYTTRRDLSGMGTFLVMGLFGIIIASIVNLFLQSNAMEWTLSILGLLVFAGFTAYDTQRIKEVYWQGHSSETLQKLVVMGALNLYMDFVNIFMNLLQLTGDRE
jgi:FtsH-binding integral membrane protein